MRHACWAQGLRTSRTHTLLKNRPSATQRHMSTHTHRVPPPARRSVDDWGRGREKAPVKLQAVEVDERAGARLPLRRPRSLSRSDRAAGRGMTRCRGGVRVAAALHARAARSERVARLFQQRVLFARSARRRRRSLAILHQHVCNSRRCRGRVCCCSRSSCRSGSRSLRCAMRNSTGEAAPLLMVGRT